MSKPILSKKMTVSVTNADGSITSEDSVSLGLESVQLKPVDGISDLSKVKFAAVGYCIYCSSTKGLSREHIVPYGLNGTAVLKDASCSDCAKITSQFEREVLQGPLRYLRVLRKLRSRRKHKNAPTTAFLEIIRNGIAESIELPLNEFPVLLHFPEFGEPIQNGIQVAGVVTVLHGPRPEDVLTRFGGSEVTLKSDYSPTAFARMLAKIGYATAFALGYIHKLDGKCPALPAILGATENIGLWVSTVSGPVAKYDGLLHRVAIKENWISRTLSAEIQIFSDSETPSYNVILGRLKPRYSDVRLDWRYPNQTLIT